MRTRITKKLVLAAAAVAVLAVPGVAHASAIGDTGITLTCDDEAVDQGEDVDCASGGWKAGTEVDVLVTLNPTLLDTTVTSNAQGQITFTYAVPDDAPDGEINVSLSGTAANGDSVTAATEAGVVGDGDPTNDGDGAVDDDEEIADTGADAGILALGAILAVGLGSAALYAARKRTVA